VLVPPLPVLVLPHAPRFFKLASSRVGAGIIVVLVIAADPAVAHLGAEALVVNLWAKSFFERLPFVPGAKTVPGR
jgi:hypothetical protein